MYELNDANMMSEDTYDSPPWRACGNVTICKQLYRLKKETSEAAELRGEFLEHCELHVGSSCFFTDESKTEDGVGYAWVGDGASTARSIQKIASNNTAELLAIQECVEYVTENGFRDVTIHTDLRSCIQSIMKYIHHNPIVQKLQNNISASGRRFNLCWVPSHVGVPLNEVANISARDAISGDIATVALPKTDYKIHVKKARKPQI